MPYKLDGNCVVKADTGKVVKCHPTHAEALAHLRALEANVPDAKDNKTFQGRLTQAEVNYVPLSGQITKKACASCRWFMNDGCFIVSNFDPEEIIATGLCDRHELSKVAEPVQPDPIPVMIVEPPMMDTDSAEMALPTTRRGLKELVLDILKPLIAMNTKETQERAFTAFKGNNGEWYWLARHTGKYVDREDEILADKAHEDYVARVQKGLVPMPELWTWHKKGTSHGVADFVWKSGGFVLALGHFTGTKEQIARAVKWYQEHPDTKLSHMFKYPPKGKKKKVYYAYNTVEITTLPNGAEAFPYTTFEGLGNMPFTKQQEEQIRGIGGEEMWQRALAADTKATGDTTKMDDAGITSKTHDNFEGSVLPDEDENKALLTAQKDMNTRLENVEKLQSVIVALDATVKTLTEKIGTMQTSEGEHLKKLNELESKLLEYQAVEPPASKSTDTLLKDREKSLINSIHEQTKDESGKSLIEQLFGNSPSIVAS